METEELMIIVENQDDEMISVLWTDYCELENIQKLYELELMTEEEYRELNPHNIKHKPQLTVKPSDMNVVTVTDYCGGL